VRVIQDVFRFLVFSNYWISIAAVLYTALTVFQLNLKIPSLLYWFVGSCTLCSYCLQRYVQLGNRKKKKSSRQYWLEGNRLHLGLTILASAILAMITGLSVLSPWQIVSCIPIVAISFIYSIRIFGKKHAKGGLRDIPGIKIFMVAISWVFLCGFLPIWINGLKNISAVEVLTISLEKFLFIFAITIPFDIRDLQLDDLRQRTIPQVIGIEKSIILAIALLFFATGLGWLCTAYSAAVFTGLLLSYVLTAIILAFVKKETKELYYSGFIDGTIALQTAAVVLAIYFL